MKKSLIALMVLAAAGMAGCEKPTGPWQSDTTKPVEPTNPNLYKNPQGIPGQDDGRPTHEIKNGGVNPGNNTHDMEMVKNPDGTISIKPRQPASAAK